MNNNIQQVAVLTTIRETDSLMECCRGTLHTGQRLDAVESTTGVAKV